MKYRKKPVVIEAWRNIFCEVQPDWLVKAIDDGIIWRITDTKDFNIKTLEGIMLASEGDYIIQGVKGELYSCRNDIFELTYEKVEE